MYSIIMHIVLCLCTVFLSSVLNAQNSYETTDEYVQNLGKPSPEITELTHIIISPFSTDTEKARAIYSWIANNISVDVKQYLKGKTGSSKPVSVPNAGAEQDLLPDTRLNKILKKKKGLSSEYANLFARMCNIAGINSVVVSGVTRMNPHLAGRTVKQNDHFWNAIYLENEWFIVDVQSGAGIICPTEKKFIKKFRSEFFLIKPETAILSHFPGSDQNQFLETNVSRAEMKNLPVIGYGYLKFGVSEYSPSSGIYQNSDPKALIIKIRFRENPEKFFTVEGSRKTEIQGFKNDEGFTFLGIDVGTRRNRIVTITGKKGEEVYDIITYKID